MDMLTPAIQSLLWGVLLWAWLFILSAMRAYRTGIAMDDPPLGFKMMGFKALRIVALLACAGGGYVMALDFHLDDFGWWSNRLDDGTLLGPVIGAGLILGLLFAYPAMMVAQGRKKQEPAGEWLTVTLVFYRWFMLGAVFWGLLAGLAGDPVIGGDPVLAVICGFIPALIYPLWWGLPAAALARAAADRNPRAAAALGRARRRGLPVWLGWRLSERKRGKTDEVEEEHKLCPSCMKPIDRVDEYISLDFDACPHCHEMIPPVFEIKAFIQDRVKLFFELDEIRQQSKKKRELASAEERGRDLMQTIVRAIITMTVRERGTDLHLLREQERFLVRCRTDGVLFTMLSFPESLLKNVVSSLKVQAGMDITEAQKPQDGSCKQVVDGTTIDMRINTSPSRTGETATLRLLYSREVIGDLNKLGLTYQTCEKVKSIINRPHGMILVTGPTGSGKTTTLYNVLTTLADGKRNIVTLEDPIEYELPGLNQMQINPRKEFTFASGLRTILRQDPDVIMIGEIRDAETAKMAVEAAMTGHMVFSTLHTIDTTTAVGRLADLEVDPHRHAEALQAVIAQRLIRLNCPHCQERYQMKVEELAAMGMPDAPHALSLRRGTGCDECHETGYFGREGIYEIFIATDAIRQLIAEKAAPNVIRLQAREDGMRTLAEDGLTRALLGRTTVEEVRRVTM